MRYILLVIGFFSCVLSNRVIAQTIPVGMLENLEDVYRREQLLGKDSLNRSFMIRPLFINSEKEQLFRKLIFTSDELKAKIYALPIVLQQQYIDKPYGGNDGAMIPAKGYQGLFSAGVFASIGPVSIQLRPEVLYAQNSKYRSILSTSNAADFVSSYKELMKSIDMPEFFGEGPYKKIYLGQSSIRVTKGPVSVGVSNENLWWGPGMRNSLLMSNNAPGFLHFTINTVEPVQTDVGNFEGQFIAGGLKSSGIPLPAKLNLQDKPDVSRSIVGIALTYQPKWAPGLFIGFDHTSVKNSDSIPRPNVPAAEFNSNLNKGQTADNYSSIFARWVMPEAHAEFYIQYGTKKYTYEVPGVETNKPGTPNSDHIRAYVAGFSKLISLNRASDEFIKVGLEITEMGNKNPRKLYPWPSWYNSYAVPGGYTNRGQLIGAAVGPGGNVQTVDVAWVKGFKRIGFQVERMVHNNDMFYTMNPYTADVRRHWVDLVLGGKIDWDFGHFILNSQLTYVRSLNYQWTFARPGDIYGNKDWWDWDKQDVNNLQAKLGVMYRF